MTSPLHDDAPLPVWSPPRWTFVSSGEGLAEVIETIRRAGDRVLGLHTLIGAEPSRDERSRRCQRPLLLAFARASDQPEGPTAWVLDPRAMPIEPLLAWLAAPDAPYVVMHDAHAVVHQLAITSGSTCSRPWSPARLGSIQAAAVLLAEGDSDDRDPPSLSTCVARLLAHRIERPTLASPSPADPGLRSLVATEASALLPVMQALTPMLRRRELTRIHALECRIVAAVVAMERTGMGVDGAAFVRVTQTWEQERQTATDAKRIARLDKLISTYAHWPREFIRGDRIHPLLHPLATDTGRFSCTDPNLQQVPSEHTAPGLRACFRSAPGYVLVVADYAQIELRVAAHLAPCDALRRVFREGRDPHRATAATITGKPESDITEHERKLAKAVNFGFLFGMGARRFRSYAADGYGVDLDEAAAQHARDAFMTTFPGIAAWHRRVGALGRAGRAVTVRTTMGRRKRFAPDRFSFNAALNIPVQGTAAEGFKLAFAELHDRLPTVGGRGVLCVHDEYVAEVPAPRAEQARALIVQTMTDAMASLVTSVPIEVEAQIEDCWR